MTFAPIYLTPASLKTLRRQELKNSTKSLGSISSHLCVFASLRETRNSHATQVAQFKKFSQPKTQEFGALDIGHDSGTSNP